MGAQSKVNSDWGENSDGHESDGAGDESDGAGDEGGGHESADGGHESADGGDGGGGGGGGPNPCSATSCASFSRLSRRFFSRWARAHRAWQSLRRCFRFSFITMARVNCIPLEDSALARKARKALSR